MLLFLWLMDFAEQIPPCVRVIMQMRELDSFFFFFCLSDWIMFFSGNKHGPNPNIRSWNRCCKSSQSHWKYPELSSCTVSDMGYDCLGKNFSTDIKPNVTVIYTGENIFICYREKMQKGNSADSKLYILNQYEPAQDSVMVPDTFLLAESVLFLLKEKNDRIIWTKSALVFLHERDLWDLTCFFVRDQAPCISSRHRCILTLGVVW